MSYDRFPQIRIRGYFGHAAPDTARSLERIRAAVRACGPDCLLMIDCYPGVIYEDLLQKIIRPLHPDFVLFTDDAVFETAEAITARVKERMTDDRVFARMCTESLEDLTDPERVRRAAEQLRAVKGLKIVYGCGARLLGRPDVLIYADMARWEIQCRFRAGRIPDWKCAEPTDDPLKKFKWGYFFVWRAADKHKMRFFDEVDFFLDTNGPDQVKLITGEALRAGLDQAVRQPFRLVPFFDPGVWGGQWMKEVCGLNPAVKNYAWCFDCVPEEISLLLRCGDTVVEIPSIDLVLYRPEALLGARVYARFGAEFPIRFDFLDTMDGQNLSLQVHPTLDYIQEQFGMAYTQEESYYILDAKAASAPSVYLGVRTGVTKEALMDELTHAQETGVPFPADRMINRIPVRQHDHLLIPPGTIHCSGKDTMVLEISATPYIFTFKLWDWGRLGLDGKPRPVHLNHGGQVIRMERDTEFVYRELVNRVETILTEDGHLREKTGLHETEFIETEREWFDRDILCACRGGVNVLNLVEGEEILVRSPDGRFEPFPVHYAETFIVPAEVDRYLLCPVRHARRSPQAKADFGVIIARVKPFTEEPKEGGRS